MSFVIIEVDDLTYTNANGSIFWVSTGHSGLFGAAIPLTSTTLPDEFKATTTHLAPDLGAVIFGEIPPAYSTNFSLLIQNEPSLIFIVISGVSLAEGWNIMFA